MTDSNILKDFGEKLSKLRKKNNLSQSAIAEITGFDQTYISLLERGERNPSLETIEIIAKALNCKASDLVS